MSTADVRIFDCVSEVLSQHLGQSEAQSYLDKIRQNYYNKHLPRIKFQVLDTAISKCRTCKNAQSEPESGWWNWQDCELMIVTSNASSDSKFANSLGKALSTAGFASAFCGCVHVTKCKFEKVSSENIDNCSNYVYDQIDVAKPQAIAVVGAAAFELFRTDQHNYTSAVGTSWYFGVYKIFCWPLLHTIEEDPSWISLMKETYQYIYGNNEDVINIQ